MYQEPMGKSRRKQFGAIPVRFTPEGQLEIMLITSRQTRRWIVPKGWPMKGLEGHDTAAREAFEEAGVNGSISDRPIGSYVYAKRLKRNSTVDCEVELFPLTVEKERRRWPEMDERERHWFSPGEAARLVNEEGLARIIEKLPDTLASGQFG